MPPIQKKPEYQSPRLVLGIETSCDETAAAVVREDGTILSNKILSQFDDHRAYGGVVPEIAARAHVEHIDHLVMAALDEAGIGFDDLDAIAGTAGPGLIGGVMVGLMTAKAIAQAKNKPFIAINHLEGHALSAMLSEDISFPYLLLLISGGHSQLIRVDGLGQYRRLGTTIDDAVGEAFDKTAKMLQLGVPGGPRLEQAALKGDAKRFKLPRPLYGSPSADFSFSGLKTAVRRQIETLVAEKQAPSDQDIADLAAGTQRVIADCLIDRTARAMDHMRAIPLDAKKEDRLAAIEALDQTQSLPFVVAGGVAANKVIRQRLIDLCVQKNFKFHAPPIQLCTDNGAMIAWAGMHYLKAGRFDGLDTVARARWPLDGDAAPMIGAGKKGAKA